MKQNRDFKGIWIPAEIWLSEELTLQEKVFLVEINSLDNTEGCFANNEYFSKFFGISKTRVSIVINKLVEKGYVTSTMFHKEGTKQILKRVLKVCYIPYQTKVIYPIQEKFKDNNTVNNTNNNTFNNIEEQKQVLPAPDEEEQDIIFIPPKRKRKDKVELKYPLSFTQDVIKSIENYMQMRKEIGKPIKSQQSFSILCNDCEIILNNYGEQTLIHSIECSTAAQWQRVYLKHPQGHNGKPHNTVKEPVKISDRDLHDKTLYMSCKLQNLRLYTKDLDGLQGYDKLEAMNKIFETYKSKQNA